MTTVEEARALYTVVQECARGNITPQRLDFIRSNQETLFRPLMQPRRDDAARAEARNTGNFVFGTKTVQAPNIDFLNSALHISDILDLHEGVAAQLLKIAVEAVGFRPNAREYVIDLFFLRRRTILESLLWIVKGYEGLETRDYFAPLLRDAVANGLDNYLITEIDRVFTLATSPMNVTQAAVNSDPFPERVQYYLAEVDLLATIMFHLHRQIYPSEPTEFLDALVKVYVKISQPRAVSPSVYRHAAYTILLTAMKILDPRDRCANPPTYEVTNPIFENNQFISAFGGLFASQLSVNQNALASLALAWRTFLFYKERNHNRNAAADAELKKLDSSVNMNQLKGIAWSQLAALFADPAIKSDRENLPFFVDVAINSLNAFLHPIDKTGYYTEFQSPSGDATKTVNFINFLTSLFRNVPTGSDVTKSFFPDHSLMSRFNQVDFGNQGDHDFYTLLDCLVSTVDTESTLLPLMEAIAVFAQPCEATANMCYAYLDQTADQTVGNLLDWGSLLQNTAGYLDKIFVGTHQGIAVTATLNEKEVQYITNYFKLVAAVCNASPMCRTHFLATTYQMSANGIGAGQKFDFVNIIHLFLCIPVAPSIKSAVFDALSAIARTKDCVPSLWESLEKSNVIGIRPRGGLSMVNEMLGTEGHLVSYDLVCSFIKYVSRLYESGVIAENLGNGWRTLGTLPYFEFVMNNVLLKLPVLNVETPDAFMMIASTCLEMIVAVLKNGWFCESDFQFETYHKTPFYAICEDFFTFGNMSRQILRIGVQMFVALSKENANAIRESKFLVQKVLFDVLDILNIVMKIEPIFFKLMSARPSSYIHLYDMLPRFSSGLRSSCHLPSTAEFCSILVLLLDFHGDAPLEFQIRYYSSVLLSYVASNTDRLGMALVEPAFHAEFCQAYARAITSGNEYFNVSSFDMEISDLPPVPVPEVSTTSFCVYHEDRPAPGDNIVNLSIMNLKTLVNSLKKHGGSPHLNLANVLLAINFKALYTLPDKSPVSVLNLVNTMLSSVMNPLTAVRTFLTFKLSDDRLDAFLNPFLLNCELFETCLEFLVELCTCRSPSSRLVNEAMLLFICHKPEKDFLSMATVFIRSALTIIGNPQTFTNPTHRECATAILTHLLKLISLDMHMCHRLRMTVSTREYIKWLFTQISFPRDTVKMGSDFLIPTGLLQMFHILGEMKPLPQPTLNIGGNLSNIIVEKMVNSRGIEVQVLSSASDLTSLRAEDVDAVKEFIESINHRETIRVMTEEAFANLVKLAQLVFIEGIPDSQQIVNESARLSLICDMLRYCLICVRRLDSTEFASAFLLANIRAKDQLGHIIFTLADQFSTCFKSFDAHFCAKGDSGIPLRRLVETINEFVSTICTINASSTSFEFRALLYSSLSKLLTRVDRSGEYIDALARCDNASVTPTDAKLKYDKLCAEQNWGIKTTIDIIGAKSSSFFGAIWRDATSCPLPWRVMAINLLQHCNELDVVNNYRWFDHSPALGRGALQNLSQTLAATACSIQSENMTKSLALYEAYMAYILSIFSAARPCGGMNFSNPTCASHVFQTDIVQTLSVFTSKIIRASAETGHVSPNDYSALFVDKERSLAKTFTLMFHILVSLIELLPGNRNVISQCMSFFETNADLVHFILRDSYRDVHSSATDRALLVRKWDLLSAASAFVASLCRNRNYFAQKNPALFSTTKNILGLLFVKYTNAFSQFVASQPYAGIVLDQNNTHQLDATLRFITIVSNIMAFFRRSHPTILNTATQTAKQTALFLQATISAKFVLSMMYKNFTLHYKTPSALQPAQREAILAQVDGRESESVKLLQPAQVTCFMQNAMSVWSRTVTNLLKIMDDNIENTFGILVQTLDDNTDKRTNKEIERGVTACIADILEQSLNQYIPHTLMHSRNLRQELIEYVPFTEGGKEQPTLVPVLLSKLKTLIHI